MNEDWEPLELRFSSEFIGGRSILLCPQCSFEFLHIIKTSVHRRDDKITIGGDEVSIRDEENTTRGSIVSIEYAGECGHHGLIIFHFYKGNIETYYKRLPELSEPFDFNDLFRD